MKMQKNVGGADKAIRLIAGIAVGVAGAYYGSWWGLLAVPLIATALMGWCGIYSLLGMNTCPPETPNAKQ